MFYIFPHYMTSHITLHLFLWQLGSPPKSTEPEMFPNSTRVFSLASKHCDCNQLPKPEIIAGFPLVFLNIRNRTRTKRTQEKINLPSIPAVWLPGKCVSNFPPIVGVFFFLSKRNLSHFWAPGKLQLLKFKVESKHSTKIIKIENISERARARSQ